MAVRMRTSPISRTAAVLIVALGLFTLLAWAITGIVADLVAGIVFVILGVFLYKMLFRLNRRIERELDEANSS